MKNISNILANRIKMLRLEKELSQVGLAEALKTKATEVSRYENGKVTPNIDKLIRLSEIFDVCTDFLLFENATRKPFRESDPEIIKYIEKIKEMDGKDRESLFHIIDAVESKNKLKALAKETK
jgi:transcriptional regulator with XRE-family HTH domain